MHTDEMYQVEVKLHLVKMLFSPRQGWRVTVHIDPMERGLGRQQPQAKRDRAKTAEEALTELGVDVGVHSQFGLVDVVADNRERSEIHLIEVVGRSSASRDQSMYASLGQLLLSMGAWGASLKYGIAVPDSRAWYQQLARIPVTVSERLDIWRYTVAPNAVTAFKPEEEVLIGGKR